MDILERLREINLLCKTLFTDPSHTLDEAANEIERLREALRPFAEQADLFNGPLADDEDYILSGINKMDLQIKHYRNARAALKEGE